LRNGYGKAYMEVQRIGIQPKGEKNRKVLVSGCLNGPPIRHNQTNLEVESPIWDRWESEGRLVSFCAELAAGFPTPRPPAEIIDGDSSTVLIGIGIVGEDIGTDVTEPFIRGAELTVAHAQANGCVMAVLTDGSPSCGSTYQYDGSFTGATRAGTGVVAQLLTDNGIRVFPETQLKEADRYLRLIEG
jgi:uncharacterized protein YbbK (DUF523 family)